MNVSATGSGAASAAAAPKSVEAAMAVKAKQVQEVQGEAAVGLIDAAAKPSAPSGTGTLVDDVA